MTKAIELEVHLARDDETGRWYVAGSDIPGLWLEADSAAALLSRLEQAAPEMIELNLEHILAARLAETGAHGPAMAVRPVFDSPLKAA